MRWTGNNNLITEVTRFYRKLVALPSRGDDVIGLERAFLSAGVSSLITSLWSIDDSSNTFLFDEFYGHLQQRLTPSAAMRAAQLEAREVYKEPFHWASFVVVGR